VRLFVYALEQVSVRGYVEPAHEKVAGISYEENAAALTDAIQFFLRKRIENCKGLNLEDLSQKSNLFPLNPFQRNQKTEINNSTNQNHNPKIKYARGIYPIESQCHN